MQPPRLKYGRIRTARAFVLGTGCGFLGGVLLTALVVWQFGNVGGSRGRGDAHPDRPPSVTELERGTSSEHTADTERATRPPAVGTAGPPPPITPPPPSPEPVLTAPPASEIEGRALVIPVEGVTANQLIPSFSERRGVREHQAIDILAPRDTPVLAVEDGTIARLFYSEAGGITIYQFDPDEQFCYYYAHLERYADGLAEGQQVRKGQVIGYVGVSGNAPQDTPHLHFAIFRLSSAKRWWEGTPIDPFDVLK